MRDGHNGILVDGNSVEEIREAISRLLEDTALYGRLRIGGLEIARQSSWKSRAEQFQTLCDRIT